MVFATYQRMRSKGASWAGPSHLRSRYLWYAVNLFAATATICGFDIPNKRYLREDYLRMSYCCKKSINSRPIDLGA